MNKVNINALIKAHRQNTDKIINAIIDYLKENGSAYLDTDLEIDGYEIILGGYRKAEDLENYVYETIILDERADEYATVRVIGVQYTDAPYSGNIEIIYVHDGDEVVQSCYLSDLYSDGTQLAYVIMDGEPFDINELEENE